MFTQQSATDLSNAVGKKITDERYIGKDGLLYCSVCNTPTQCKINWLGRETVVNCLCEHKEAEAKNGYYQNKYTQRLKRLQEKCFNEPSMNSKCFENNKYDLPCVKRFQNYCNKFESLVKTGSGILLYGSNGSGKTFFACCIANELMKRGYRCLFTSFSELSENTNNISNLTDYDLVIFDDLGAERNSEYMQEIAFRAVDLRYRANKPMIITTNLTAEDMKNSPDNARIYNRIFEKCYPFKMNETKIRIEEIKGNFKYLQTEFDEV